MLSHADWSKNPAKRWMAIAVLQTNHRWLICGLTKVVEPSSFFLDLKSRLIKPGCILAGFDFPIGIPSSYASKAGITDFLAALPLFGYYDWAQFYTPAELPFQIILHRPFYPFRPGNSMRIHLEQGLDLQFSELYRLCEKRHVNRRAACPLFWTMGGHQVGKAAITGWESLIAPVLTDQELKLKIWPFSGSLAELCARDNIVVVETYPAEFYGHLELSFSAASRRSKRRNVDRKAFAEQLISWAVAHNLDMDDSIIVTVKNGFGSGLDGEDRFDALVGLYGMINVILGNHSTGEPLPPQTSKIEGWIFGQEQPI